MPRTGRPTDDPKNTKVTIRMSNNYVEKLEYCSKKTGLAKADVVRKGIDEVYESIKDK